MTSLLLLLGPMERFCTPSNAFAHSTDFRKCEVLAENVQGKFKFAGEKQTFLAQLPHSSLTDPSQQCRRYFGAKRYKNQVL